jgi:hypothetical protein
MQQSDVIAAATSVFGMHMPLHKVSSNFAGAMTHRIAKPHGTGIFANFHPTDTMSSEQDPIKANQRTTAHDTTSDHDTGIRKFILSGVVATNDAPFGSFNFVRQFRLFQNDEKNRDNSPATGSPLWGTAANTTPTATKLKITTFNILQCTDAARSVPMAFIQNH